MSEHRASISWTRSGDDFGYETYSRDHSWSFEGGVQVPASAASAYFGDPSRVDPEEALVASISSCHMLTFLAIASRKRFVVDSYVDEAVGYMEKNADGRLAVTRAELRPQIQFGGDRRPTPSQIEEMHHSAHEHCFIANSVQTEITVRSDRG